MTTDSKTLAITGILNNALRGRAPEGNMATDKVLYRWEPDEETAEERQLLKEAIMCRDQGIAFMAYDKRWRITYAEIDETDMMAIEGVEWPD